MAGKKVITMIETALENFLKEHSMEVYNTEFQKEGRDWYLRVYVDKTDDTYISTEDCEMVSNYLSEYLDREDPIEENYYLEISSPGMDRELIKKAHFEKYLGQQVDIKLYEPLEGGKEHSGKLLNFVCEKDDAVSEVTLELKIDTKADKRKPGSKVSPKAIELKEVSFPKEKIAKISLAVIF